MTCRKLPQVTFENLTSTLTLLILCVQVILLALLSTRLARLEKAFTSLAGNPAPSLVERTPDERGQVIGPDNAEITIVEFSDFGCPYCAETAIQIKRLLEKNPGQIRFVYRHFPLSPNTFSVAESAECAGEQGKFWQMHDALFANQSALSENNLQEYAAAIGLDMASFNDCMASGRTRTAIEQDLADGQKYRVNGTPTLFVNNMRLTGVSILEEMFQNALTGQNR